MAIGNAQEILRHHKTDKHLRIDQRWRYDNEPYELERELPNFKNFGIVTIAPNFSFDDEEADGLCRPSTVTGSR